MALTREGNYCLQYFPSLISNPVHPFSVLQRLFLNCILYAMDMKTKPQARDEVIRFY